IQTRQRGADVPALAELAERWADGDRRAKQALATLLAGRNISSNTPSGARALAGAPWPAARKFIAAKAFGKGTLIASLLRDIIGTPFHAVVLEPAWLTPEIISLARAAYEERIMPACDLDRARLAVLADALEEAGCTDTRILDHLRRPGAHVRGCWVVDLVLGQS